MGSVAIPGFAIKWNSGKVCRNLLSGDFNFSKTSTFGKYFGKRNSVNSIPQTMLKLNFIALFIALYPFLSKAQTAPTIASAGKFDSTISRLESINRDIWIPFSEAYSSADADKYISLHSPDFIRASGGARGAIFDLKKYAENSRAGFQRGKEQGFKTQIRFAFIERIVGAEFGSERGIYHYHSDNGKGESYDGYGKFHVVERLENGRWKILFDYDSNENGTIGKDDFDAAFSQDDWSVLTQQPSQLFDLNAVRQHIEAANTMYGERFKTSDPAWYAARYTRDACILPEKLRRICGLENIIGYYYSNGGNQSISIRITMLEISGGAEAVVEEGLYEITNGDAVVLDKGKFLATWVQESGIWKLRREIWTTDESN